MTVTLSVLGVCLVAGVFAVVRKRARREADNLRRATAWAEPIPSAPVSLVDDLRRKAAL
jgi:hypothetical protein